MKIDLSKYADLPDNACLTIAEMAQLLGKSQSMVRKLMEAKKLPEAKNANSNAKIVFSRNLVRHVWPLGVLRQWQKQLEKTE